ncbi:hypothetical protein VUR80DRAFT_1811 [Thermomyces stellatus]
MYARYIPPPKPKPAPAAKPTWEGLPEGEAVSEARGVEAPAPPVPADAFSYARYVPPTGSTAPATLAEDAKKRKRDGDADGRGGKKVKASESGSGGTTADEASTRGTEETLQEVGGAVEDGKPGAEEKSALSDREERRRRKEEKGRKREEKRRKADEHGRPSPKKTAEGHGPESVEVPTPRKPKTSEDDQPKGHLGESQDSDVEMATPSHSESREPKPEKEKKPKKEKKKKRRETDEQDPAEDTVAPHHKAVLEKKEKALRNIRLPASPAKDAPQPLDNTTENKPEPEPVAHGLEPLPQPEPIALDAAPPAFDGLPPWIAEPIRVEETTCAPFTSLGIPEKVARALELKGYKEAFAVQTAAIPLLLPTAKRLQGDVLVSAATGSGKTLAYAIPIVRDISLGVVTRLRALVVLPTRELVKQAKEAFESVSAAFDGQGKKRVRIGIAYGSQSLKTEQGALVTREEVYDPEAYQNAEDEEARKDSLLENESTGKGILKGTLPDHVVSFGSAVDVLICTPGRLVDHIQQTEGFVLDYVRWLVIDEGDKLLGQNYQNWIPIVTGALRAAEDNAALGARDFPQSNLSGVRKVFLSATLTSRGSLAAMRELELRRPRLVVLGGERADKAEHVLPMKLREYAIRLKDENLKPLYLNELLLSDRLRAGQAASPEVESGSDSDSDSDSSVSKAAFTSTALIFTKSNESALRLTRLLSHLSPALASLTATLTSATPPHVRRRTIAQFASHRIRLLVASDLVARGIDLPLLDHVVNYDLPPSVEAYVHRVGRTARAGREGCAWSLVPDGKEGGWFWGEVVKGARIHRENKVERVVLGNEGEISEEKVEEYERALGELAKEASGRRMKE